MKKIFCIIFLLFPLVFFAQITITGKVLEIDQNPLPGASILIKGTSKGFTSDFNGVFNVKLDKIPATLVVSYLGYKTKEITINNQKNITVVLVADSRQLEEIIIIGYGTSSKSDVTAAITTIKPAVERKAGVAAIESLLKGTSGINVLSNGEPGTAVSINIRGISSLSGSNQPLYVIDGIIMDSAEEFLTDPTNFQTPSKSGIGGVAPEDIETIQVLKDASATAIYGSLGANGVILITTKSGKKGAPKFKFSNSTTVGKAVLPYNILNTGNYVSFMNDKYAENPNSIADPDFLFPAGRSPFEIRPDGLYNFLNRNDEDNDGELDLIGVFESKDWTNSFRTTFSTNTRLSVSGGTDKTKYYASVGYLSNEGVIPNVYLDKLDLNVNVKFDINDKLDLGAKISYTNSKNSLVGGSGSNAGENNSVYRHIYSEFPLEVREDIAPLEDEGFRITPRGWLEDYDNISNENRVIGNFSLNYKFLENVTYNLKLGGDLRKANADIWQGPSTSAGFLREGRYAFSELDRTTFNIDQTIEFKPKRIGDHRYTLLGGVVYTNTESEKNYTRASNYSAAGQLNRGRDFFGASIIEAQVLNFDPERLLSFLGRGTYAYKNRYKVSGSLRYDGSSKFIGKNRFGLFPAISVAWEAHKESFLKNNKYNINQLKFRLGYGETGNQRVGNNLASVNYRITPEGYATGGTLQQAFEKTNIASVDLKWETQKQFNAGIDLAMFNNRFSLTLDAYDKTSDDLLNTLSIGGSAGDDAIVINQGLIKNRGLELALNGSLVETEDFNWDLYATYSLNDVVIENLGLEKSEFGAAGEFSGYFGRPIQLSGTNTVPTNVYLEGQAPGLFFGFETNGIINANDIANNSPTIFGTPAQEGFYKIVDKNNDGNINDEDKTLIGNPNPDFLVSFGTNFNYKNWSFSASFYGVYGNDIYNANYLSENYSAENRYNNVRTSYIENAYSATNQTGTLPAVNLENATLNGVGVLDVAVSDGSYLRLQNINLGYSVPLKSTSVISQFKVFLSMNNVYTWTNYSGIEPEISSLRFTAGVVGVDIATPPNQRTFSLGGSINF